MIVAASTWGWAAVGTAEVKVELSEMHICCNACVKGIENAVKDIPGVTVEVDKEAATTVVKADDARAAEKAIEAIAHAGFHGVSNHADLKMKDDSGAAKGSVARLELTNIHNCCGGCMKAVKGAVKDVKGVTGDTLKPKETRFVVEGRFSPAEVIAALNAAGFHAKIVR
jgi:copper chaperone CopZ